MFAILTIMDTGRTYFNRRGRKNEYSSGQKFPTRIKR